MTAIPSVFLCGFMSSGKSHLGKKTAMLLGLEYYDLDSYIEEKEKRNITDIFEHDGESAFRRLETLHLKTLLDTSAHCLIALGGGTVCFNNNLEILRSKGLLVYLEMPAAALTARLIQNTEQRPLLKGKSKEEIFEFVNDLLNKRKKYYECSHLKVNALDLNAEQLANEIRSYN